MDIDILNLPQKCRQNAFYGSKTCICQNFVVILRAKSQKAQKKGQLC